MSNLIRYSVVLFSVLIIAWYLKGISEYFSLIRSKFYKSYTDERIDNLVKELKNKMQIEEKVVVKRSTNRKDFGADVSVFRDKIYIVLHGEFDYEFLRFAIAHEFAHIKLEHRKQNNNSIFILSLSIIYFILGEVVTLTNMNIVGNSYLKFKTTLDIFVFCIFLTFIFLDKLTSTKRLRNNELEADLLAVRYCGVKIAEYAILKLRDSSEKNILDKHPSNYARINFIRSNWAQKRPERTPGKCKQ